MSAAVRLTVGNELRYDDVRAFVTDALGEDFDFVTSPGPATDESLQRLSPQAIVFLTVGGGAGLTGEQLFDRPFISARVIGRQADYGSAEDLALALHALLCSVVDNTVMGTTMLHWIVPSGGRPQLLQKDSADRYHFTCSYITECESGL